MKTKFKYVDKFPIQKYSCGLIAGQKVKIIKTISTLDHTGKPTGKTHNVGEIWKVMPGSDSPPIVLWLLQPDGKYHTWDDDLSVFEYFEPLGN